MITWIFAALFSGSYFWARRSLKMSVSDASVLALTVGFPNSAAVALPLFATAYGPAPTVTAALSIESVQSPSLQSPSHCLRPTNRRMEMASHSQLCWAVFPVPAHIQVVWAPALALVWVYFGLHLPSYINRTLTTMGSAASASALVLTGLVVSAQKFRFDKSVCVDNPRPSFSYNRCLRFVYDLALSHEPRPGEGHHGYQRNSRRILGASLRKSLQTRPRTQPALV